MKVLEIDGDEYGQDDEDEPESDEKWERICLKAKVFDMDSNDVAGSQ